jgi:hypothetical protein
MQDQVEIVLVGAVLGVVDGQRAIAYDAVKVRPPEVESIAAEELPSEIAADAKASDIAEELKLASGRQLVPYTQSDKRIDPLKRTGSRDGARTRPLETKVAKVDRSIDC